MKMSNKTWFMMFIISILLVIAGLVMISNGQALGA